MGAMGQVLTQLRGPSTSSPQRGVAAWAAATASPSTEINPCAPRAGQEAGAEPNPGQSPQGSPFHGPSQSLM